MQEDRLNLWIGESDLFGDLLKLIQEGRLVDRGNLDRTG